MGSTDECQDIDECASYDVEYEGGEGKYSHSLGTKLKHIKMCTLQFYFPGFQNDPSYPKEKEFLKSTKGNLK